MNLFKLEDMIKGWFIGSFTPNVQHSKDFEIAFKKYKAGEKEENHFHKVATEITLVAYGEIRMCNKVFKEGDIIVLKPGESTEFEAITDAANVVVKTPSLLGDKYSKKITHSK